MHYPAIRAYCQSFQTLYEMEAFDEQVQAYRQDYKLMQKTSAGLPRTTKIKNSAAYTQTARLADGEKGEQQAAWRSHPSKGWKQLTAIIKKLGIQDRRAKRYWGKKHE